MKTLKGLIYIITHHKDSDVKWHWHMMWAHFWIRMAKFYREKGDWVEERLCAEHVKKHYKIIRSVEDVQGN